MLLGTVCLRAPFYVQCMFVLILHIICPITLACAIEMPQAKSRQNKSIKYFSSCLGNVDIIEIVHSFIHFVTPYNKSWLRIKKSTLVKHRRLKHRVKLPFFSPLFFPHLTSSRVALKLDPDATDTDIKKTLASKKKKIIVRL